MNPRAVKQLSHGARAFLFRACQIAPSTALFQAMQDRSSTDKPPTSPDDAPVAKRKNAAAVALGRRGGKKGGPARAASMTPEERSELARTASNARWAKVQAE